MKDKQFDILFQENKECQQLKNKLTSFETENMSNVNKQCSLVLETMDRVLAYIIIKAPFNVDDLPKEKEEKCLHDFYEIPFQVRERYLEKINSIVDKTTSSISDETTYTFEDFVQKQIEATQYICNKVHYTSLNYAVINICLFIIEDFFLSKVSTGIYSLDNIPFNSSMKTPVEDLYGRLKDMHQIKALEFIKLIPCSTSVWDSLVKNFKKNNKAKFINTIHNDNCNLTTVQKLCYIDSRLKYLRILYDKRIKSMSATLLMENTPQQKNELYPFSDEIQKYEKEILNPLLDILFSSTIESVDPEKKHYKAYNLCMILRSHADKELQYTLDRFITIFQKEANENVTTPSDSENTVFLKDNDQFFSLPDDYFAGELCSDSNSYFCKLTEYVKKKGGKVFEDLINFLAEEGYIEATFETKATLIFRLTGIGRVELQDKIEWKKDASCLFYIIRFFFEKSDDKSSKIRDFFYCGDKTFEKVNCFSAYAKKGAPTSKDSFLVTLRMLYPEIEKNKGNTMKPTGYQKGIPDK